MRCRRIILVLVALAISSQAAASEHFKTEALRTAVLEGDWGRVTELVERDTSSEADPVLRALLGHAAVAENRNDDALRLFASLGSDNGLKEWQLATSTLVREHPGSHISHYLYGDALARQGMNVEAIREFDAALRERPDFAMAMVARGSVRAVYGDRDGALIDFRTATEAAPNLAEAWASLGVLWLRFEAADGALKALHRAEQLNRTFGVVHLAKGVAHYGRGEFMLALTELEKARACCPELARVATSNIALVEMATGETSAAMLAAAPVPSQSVGSSILIDIPGVNWKGEHRANNWGELLAEDRLTVHVRHQGETSGSWIDDPLATVITMPPKWDENSAAKELLPVIRRAFSADQDLHVVVDKNITLAGHLQPLPRRAEDEWSAHVVEYIAKHRPAKYNTILAAHSRGTVTYRYISDFSRFNTVIVASPRGDDALSWIENRKNMPETFVVTGLTDAPAFRWTQRLTRLREHPNVTIVQFQELGTPAKTHSKLQNLSTTGEWKIITTNGVRSTRGSLRQVFGQPTVAGSSPGNRVEKQPVTVHRRRTLDTVPSPSQHTYPPPPPPPPPPPGPARSGLESAPPGGVSMAELGQAWVDEGGWPLVAVFGLFYQAAPDLGSQ